ncbi:DUF3800 domain-containing protein [Caulobacter sp. RHG1]|uniref:DUF3800 domain-containing protein n=1 Tax=Caulobacter sp. (strain RHG1) TaxID=2545762 RepID=UPI0015567584|nr:DUF3800 domain-containing protein [Caulobacter sp. RHG1]
MARPRRERLLQPGPLLCFVDDSVGQSGAQQMFLAGYLNRKAQWAVFSAAWRAALKAPPSIDYLHMVEAQNLRGQFKGWSEADRDRKVLGLAKLIADSRPVSMQVSVSRQTFQAILAPNAPYGLSQPYFTCFYALTLGLARFAHAGGVKDPIAFVFDEQGVLGQDATMVYDWVKAGRPEPWSRLLGPPPTFGDDRSLPQLQAADMLAWHVRRDAEGLDPPGSRPALDLLRGDGRHVMLNLTADILADLARDMRTVPNLDSVRTKRSWRDTRQAILALQAAGAGPPEALNAPSAPDSQSAIAST